MTQISINYGTIFSIIFSGYLLYAFNGLGAETIIRFIRQGQWKRNYQEAINKGSMWLLRRYPVTNTSENIYSFKNTLSKKLFSDLHLCLILLMVMWVPVYWYVSGQSIDFGFFELLSRNLNLSALLPILSTAILLVLLLFPHRAKISLISLVLYFLPLMDISFSGSSILSLYVASLIFIYARKAGYRSVEYMYSLLPLIFAVSIAFRGYVESYVYLFWNVRLDIYLEENIGVSDWGFNWWLITTYSAPILGIASTLYFLFLCEKWVGMNFKANFILTTFILIIVVFFTPTYAYEYDSFLDVDALIGPILFPLVIISGGASSAFISIAVTRYCAFRGARRVGYGTLMWSSIDLGIAAIGVCLSIFISFFIFQLFNAFFLDSVVNVEYLIEGFSLSWRDENSWLLILPLISFLPSFLHASLAFVISIPSVFPRRWREALARLLEKTRYNPALNFFVLFIVAVILTVYFTILYFFFELVISRIIDNFI